MAGVLKVSDRPVKTTLTLTLTEDEDGRPRLKISGAVYNRELCVKMLRIALEGIGDRAPTQVDCGVGGQRLLLPVSPSLVDLYHSIKKKV